MDLLQPLFKNWALVTAAILVISIPISGFLLKIKKTEHALKAYQFFIIIAALVLLIVQIAYPQRPEFRTMVDALGMTYARENPYLKDKINADISRIMDTLDEGHFTTPGSGITREELLRAMQMTKKGDTVWAIDYGIPWRDDFELYHLENVAAAKRGVDITRIFIISENLEQSAKNVLHDVMKEQKEKNIRVKVAKKERVSKICGYPESPEGMVLFQYGNYRSILMKEVSPFSSKGKDNAPGFYKLEVHWSDRMVSKHHEFFHCLLQQPEFVQDFNPSHRL